LSGAFKHDPKRAIERVNEPIPTGEIGTPPACLNEAEQTIWNRLCHECAPGVMKNSDRTALMALCKITYKVESGGFDLTAADYGQLKAYLQQFGMSPAARSLVQVKQEESGNEFVAI
jgi:hypothetical protein